MLIIKYPEAGKHRARQRDLSRHRRAHGYLRGHTDASVLLFAPDSASAMQMQIWLRAIRPKTPSQEPSAVTALAQFLAHTVLARGLVDFQKPIPMTGVGK